MIVEVIVIYDFSRGEHYVLVIKRNRDRFVKESRPIQKVNYEINHVMIFLETVYSRNLGLFPFNQDVCIKLYINDSIFMLILSSIYPR